MTKSTATIKTRFLTEVALRIILIEKCKDLNTI